MAFFSKLPPHVSFHLTLPFSAPNTSNKFIYGAAAVASVTTVHVASAYLATNASASFTSAVAASSVGTTNAPSPVLLYSNNNEATGSAFILV